MIISKLDVTGRHIFKYWRENGEKKTEIVEFSPYFYVSDEGPRPRKYSPSEFIERDFRYEETDAKTLNGEGLLKVYVDSAEDIREAERHLVLIQHMKPMFLCTLGIVWMS